MTEWYVCGEADSRVDLLLCKIVQSLAGLKRLGLYFVQSLGCFFVAGNMLKYLFIHPGAKERHPSVFEDWLLLGYQQLLFSSNDVMPAGRITQGAQSSSENWNGAPQNIGGTWLLSYLEARDSGRQAVSSM